MHESLQVYRILNMKEIWNTHESCSFSIWVFHTAGIVYCPIKVQFTFRTSPSTEGTQNGVEYMLSYLFHSQYFAALHYDLSITGIWVPEVKGYHSPFIKFSSIQLFSFEPCNLGQREFILPSLLFSNWEPKVLLELLLSHYTLWRHSV